MLSQSVKKSRKSAFFLCTTYNLQCVNSKNTESQVLNAPEEKKGKEEEDEKMKK